MRSLGNSGAPALVVDRGRLAREFGDTRQKTRAQGSREEQNVGRLATAGPREPLEFRLEGIAHAKRRAKRGDRNSAGEDTDEREPEALAQTLEGKGDHAPSSLDGGVRNARAGARA